MSKQDLLDLVHKITTGVATDEEIIRFNQWYKSFQKAGSHWPESELGDKKRIESMLIRSIDQRINNGPLKKDTTIFQLRRIAVAVIALILIGGGIYWYFMGQQYSGLPGELVISNDVEPGAEKAVLTLGDGSTIMLDEANKGLIAREGDMAVQKTADGSIIYLEGEHFNPEEGTVVFNTISTPRGGQFKVTLPDHTQVWLNAMSSIRFPTRFTGSSRSVEITGEVYFEVTHQDTQPFLVHSAGQTIKVLGTEFNVKAYEDEKVIRTTLVSGSVQVETANERIEIEPGQQAILGQDSKLSVTSVDIDQATAWKNGIFQFWNTELKEIMRQLSRWYDVEVVYLNERDDISFTGFISRDVSISNVLQMLQEAGNIEFGLEGREVVVRIGNVNDHQ